MEMFPWGWNAKKILIRMAPATRRKPGKMVGGKALTRGGRSTGQKKRTPQKAFTRKKILEKPGHGDQYDPESRSTTTARVQVQKQVKEEQLPCPRALKRFSVSEKKKPGLQN